MLKKKNFEKKLVDFKFFQKVKNCLSFSNFAQ